MILGIWQILLWVTGYNRIWIEFVLLWLICDQCRFLDHFTYCSLTVNYDWQSNHPDGAAPSSSDTWHFTVTGKLSYQISSRILTVTIHPESTFCAAWWPWFLTYGMAYREVRVLRGKMYRQFELFATFCSWYTRWSIKEDSKLLATTLKILTDFINFAPLNQKWILHLTTVPKRLTKLDFTATILLNVK